MCYYEYSPSGRNYKIKHLRRSKSIEELNERYFELLEMAKYQEPISSGKNKGKYRHVNKAALAEKYRGVIVEKGYRPHIDGARVFRGE